MVGADDVCFIELDGKEPCALLCDGIDGTFGLPSRAA